MPAFSRKSTALLILTVIAFASLLSTASMQPFMAAQATATLSPDEILLTPPLARTPLPTDMPGGSGNGWMAASLMLFLCMVGMLAGGMMIAFVVFRIRQQRERR